jgi:hypothetical protein
MVFTVEQTCLAAQVSPRSSDCLWMAPQAAFSFYDWVLQNANAEQTGLRRLVDTTSAKPAPGELTTNTRAMLHWCRVVEHLTLERHASGASVYAGFERTSRIRPVLKRYQRLSQVVDRLVILGELDEKVDLDAELIDVTGCALAREWFLVVHAPDYEALLVARDLDGFSPTGPLTNRRFLAGTLTDRAFVQLAIDRLEQYIR